MVALILLSNRSVLIQYYAYQYQWLPWHRPYHQQSNQHFPRNSTQCSVQTICNLSETSTGDRAEGKSSMTMQSRCQDAFQIQAAKPFQGSAVLAAP